MDKPRPGRWPAELPPFLWGVATSAHQVEGHNHNDWTDWEAAGRVARHEQSGAAADHWHRYREDLALFARFGLNAYRFSVEWSRIEPEPDRIDQQALDHYRRLVDECRRLGLEPLLTLHHFTLPRWLARRGGFAAADAEERVARYVDTVLAALGSRVRLYVTINEPMVYLVMGYGLGVWPPGEKGRLTLIFRLTRRLARIHRRAYRQIKAQRPDALVSIAHHVVAFHPHRRPIDTLLAHGLHWLFNERFLQLIDGHFDYLGVNYYTRRWASMRKPLMPLDSLPGAELTDMGWEIYPAGLTHLLCRLARFGTPLIVTENGIATRDDTVRSRFIADHLRAIGAAQAAGAEVRGYFYWSGLDNFEWAEGFLPRFGLVAVDYTTGERHLRPSHATLQAWAEYNRGRCRLESPPAAFEPRQHQG